MRNGERPGGDSANEPIVTGYEHGIPPFGGGDAGIDVPLDSDDEFNGGDNIDNDELAEMLSHDEPVQFEDDGATGIDVPIEGENPQDSESFAEKQKELKEAFDIAISRFDSAYYGDNISSEESGKRILKIESLMDDRGEKAALHNVEDFSFDSPSEITQDIIDEVNRVTEIIEELDLDDDLGAGSENNPDLEEEDESRAELLENLDDSASEFKSAIIETGLWAQNSDGDFDLEPLYAKLREIGEDDAFKVSVNSWVNIHRNPESAKPEDINAVKAELDRLAEVLKNLKADVSGEDGDDGGEGGEGGEDGEDGEKKAELIEKLTNTRDIKRIELLLGKIGLNREDGLDGAEAVLASKGAAELEQLLKEIEDELTADKDKSKENGENREYLRKLNFGEWLAVKYDVPGPDSKYFNPDFFSADRKLQQQVMQEYMALFEADANYEKDREFMVNELCRREFAKKSLEELGLDPSSTDMGELEPMLNKMKFEDLNELYRKVFYGPKPEPKPAEPKPAEPKPAEPKTTPDSSVEPDEPKPTDPSDNPDVGGSNPDTGNGKNPDVDPSHDADKDMAESIKEVDKKIPTTADEVRDIFDKSPNARLVYGEQPSDELVSKTLEEVKVWKKLSDAQKADFLKYGVVSGGVDFDTQITLMELRKKGILPKYQA